MLPLKKTQRIEELIMLGYRDRTRTQQEVYNVFNIKHPNTSITQSNVSKIWKKFRETGYVKHVANARRPPINDNIKLDVILGVAEKLFQGKVDLIKIFLKGLYYVVLKKNNYHPYKIHNAQEINEDDPDRRMQFCEVMQNVCNQNPHFILSF